MKKRKKSHLVIVILSVIIITSMPGYSQSNTQNQTAESIEDRIAIIQVDLEKLESLNITSQYVRDKIEQAVDLHNQGRDREAQALLDQAERQLALIWSVRDEIEATRAIIEELEAQGLNSTRANNLLEEAEEKFLEEDYDSAMELLSQAQQAASEEQALQSILAARYRAARDNAIAYVRDHPLRVTSTLIAIIGILLFSGDTVYRMRKKREIALLEREIHVTRELLKKIDREYFIEKKISREARDIARSRYREDIERIQERLPVAKRELELGLLGTTRERLLGLLRLKKKQ